MRSLPNTLLLGGIAFALSIAVAVPIGIVSALRRDSIWDYLGVGLALLGQAMPPYWLGIMLILVFSVKLHILPTSGSFGPEYVVLPSVTLAAVLMPIVTRLVRSGMLEVLHEDYVRTARAKGLRERVVVGNHALRNIPADRMRMHICWGNYEAPHTHDIPLEDIVDRGNEIGARCPMHERRTGEREQRPNHWSINKESLKFWCFSCKYGGWLPRLLIDKR